MLKMNKRGKDVNWSKLANASPKPKRLHLEEDDCRRKQLQYVAAMQLAFSLSCSYNRSTRGMVSDIKKIDKFRFFGLCTEGHSFIL